MHEHNQCKHNLEFCYKCDTVYCEYCKEEWKKNTWNGYSTGKGNYPIYGTAVPVPYCNNITPGSEGQIYNTGTGPVNTGTNHTH